MRRSGNERSLRTSMLDTFRPPADANRFTSERSTPCDGIRTYQKFGFESAQRARYLCECCGKEQLRERAPHSASAGARNCRPRQRPVVALAHVSHALRRIGATRCRLDGRLPLIERAAHLVEVVEDDAVREAFLRLREEAEPRPFRDRGWVDAERGCELDARDEVLRSMRRSECKDPFPQIVSFQTGSETMLSRRRLDARLDTWAETPKSLGGGGGAKCFLRSCFDLAVAGGLEPPTTGLTIRRSTN